MGYVLLSSGSNYNFAVGNNTYVTTESEEAVEHLRKTLEEKMAENLYTRGNYKLKAPPIKVLDALRAIDYSVVSSGGSDGRFIWTLMKLPPITIYPSATSAAPSNSNIANNNLLDPIPPMSPPPLPLLSHSGSSSGQGGIHGQGTGTIVGSGGGHVSSNNNPVNSGLVTTSNILVHRPSKASSNGTSTSIRSGMTGGGGGGGGDVHLMGLQQQSQGGGHDSIVGHGQQSQSIIHGHNILHQHNDSSSHHQQHQIQSLHHPSQQQHLLSDLTISPEPPFSSSAHHQQQLSVSPNIDFNSYSPDSINA